MAGSDNTINFVLAVDSTNGEVAVKRLTTEFKTMGATAVKASDDAASAMQRWFNTHHRATEQIVDTLQQVGEQGFVAGEKIDEGGQRAARGLMQAQIAAQGLSRELGISLPRIVTRFLAQSEMIGPVLTAAFAPIAILGMIEALEQVPKVYARIEGAVTGWNDKAKKATEDQIELNRKYLDVLRDIEQAQINLELRAGMITNVRATNETIGNKQQQLDAANREIARIQSLQNIRRLNETYGLQNLSDKDLQATLRAKNLPNISGKELHAALGGESNEALADALKRSSAEATKLDIELRKIRGEQLPLSEYEDTAKWFSEAEKSAAIFAQRVKEQAQYREFFTKQLEDERIRSGKGGPMAEEVTEGLKVADGQAKLVIKDLNEMNKVLQQAGDEFIKNQDYWAKQLETFRIKPIGASEQIKEGEKAGEAQAKQIIKQYNLLQKEQEKFRDSFREGAGRVWDDFFIKGQSVFASLANTAKAFLALIARTFFQDFTTGLLFGGPARGGIAGGLSTLALGGRAGLLGSGGGTFGAGSLGGGIFSLAGGAGLFGGPLGAGTHMGTGALAGTVVSSPSGGLAGALGLGGGAGLFGLGAAATIPVIGGAALGIGLLLHHLFGHKPKPVAGSDPWSELRSMTYQFNTTFPFEKLNTTLDTLSHSVGKLDNTLGGLSTMDPGQVMLDNAAVMKEPTKGFVADGLASDRSFRKSVAGQILEQPI
jgi:hypothetical protein